MTSFAQHPDPPFTLCSFHQFLSTVREIEQHSNQAPVLCPVFETDLNKPNMGYNLCLLAVQLYITSAFLYSTCLLLCCRWWQIHLTLNNGAFRNAHYDRRLPVVKAIYFRKKYISFNFHCASVPGCLWIFRTKCLLEGDFKCTKDTIFYLVMRITLLCFWPILKKIKNI